MTTTISLATRDCIVLGCDSLGTSSAPMIDPFRFADQFFEKDGNIKVDESGKPLLNSTSQLSAFVRRLPRDQLPNVTKLFHLKPYPIGVTFAGSSVIGEYSIKNLVDAFLADAANLPKKEQATVETVGASFFEFVRGIHEAAYGSWADNLKPRSDILLSGYSFDSLVPEVFRLSFGEKAELIPEIKRGEFSIRYSGQYDVIERVVDGIDLHSYIALNDRCELILRRYKHQLEEHLKKALNVTVDLPTADTRDPKLGLFGEKFGGISGLKANTESLTEQAAINFVEFLVDTMIKAQQFSGAIPTVGGDIHVAIITKANGFCWISKEQYTFKGNVTDKHVRAS